MAKHFPNLIETINTRIKKAQITLSINIIKETPIRHIIIRFVLKTSDKEKNLKNSKRRQITYRRTNKRMIA